MILSTGLTAQISIDSSDMPKNGDSFRYSVGLIDSAIFLNYQKSDTNLIWNFGDLVPIRQGVTEFVAPAETPYSSSISNGIGEKFADTLALGFLQIYDVYNFHANSKDEFITDFRGASVPTGLSFPLPEVFKIAESFDDPDEVYQFPLEYSDRDSSTYEFTFRNVFPPAYFSSSGYRINHVDAWGELTTPFGTFECIRVVTDVVGFDSISFDTNNIGLASHIREYKWLTKDFQYPALTINGTVIEDSIFVPINVEYRDSLRDVPSLFSPIALFIANDFNPQTGDTVSFQNLSISPLPANYEWEINPTSFNFVDGTSSNTDSITVIFNDTGWYDVQLIAINSDGRDTLLIENYIRVDSSATGLEELLRGNNALSAQIKIAPNPISSDQYFYLQFPNEFDVNNIGIFDAGGKLLQNSLISSNDCQLLNSKCARIKAPDQSGLYYVVMNTSKGRASKKLIVGP